VGVVSASDITASDVDLPSFNQENAQVEIDENYEISASYESSDSLSGEYGNSVEISADESSLSDVCECVEVSGDVDFISYAGDDEIYDSYDDLIMFISTLRKYTDDDVVIYTGYEYDEIKEDVDWIAERYKNIIIKFGRFIPNQESHYDPILGVRLASPNQHAEKIS
jgi:hypothetical protein